MPNGLKTLNISLFISDVLFYSLGVYCFYNNIFFVCLVNVFLLIAAKYKGGYKKNNQNKIVNEFMDFLNHINSHVSVGESFRTSIMAQQQIESNCTNALKKLVILNGTDEQILFTILQHYPIPEAVQFNKLLRGAIHSSRDASKVISVTLDQLYIKFKTSSAAEMILFQKKIEHIILTLAPLFVILMIRISAPTYLNIMYETSVGKIIMTFALFLLIAMKLIGTSIINIRW